MARELASFGSRSLVYLLAFFPLFYLAYKFHIPDLGASDYYRYHEMYLHPLDFGAAPEPWVLRQVQAVVVSLLARTGFDYETEIAFATDSHARGVFFSALAVNFLSVVLSAALLGSYLQRLAGRADLVSWGVPGLMVFNFSIVFFAFSGLTEGLSLLFFTSAYLAYRTGRYTAAAVVVLATAFQRELVALILLGLAAADMLGGSEREDRRGRIAVLLCAVLSVGVNMGLRLYLARDPAQSQVSPGYLMSTLSELSLPGRDFVFQVLLTQNLALVVALVTLLFYFAAGRAPRVGRRLLRDCGLTFGIVLIAGLAASVGNNIGRLLIFWTPSLALILAQVARDWTSVQAARNGPDPASPGPGTD